MEGPQESLPQTRATAVPWKLTLCYDGSRFAGWQVQPGHSTVQGELAQAIARVTGERTLPQGSGRTDAGVHALAQVASVLLRAPIPPASLQRALNHILPAAIRILDAQHAPPGFHARHSSVNKTYEYRVWRNALCLPWLAPYVYPFTFPVSIERLHAAAEAVLGTHDFRSFQAQDQDLAGREHDAQRSPRTTIRTIYTSRWETSSGNADLLVYRVSGSGFLHHMVRNLAGTMLAIGRGQLPSNSMPTILAACSRSAAGPTAPAGGLWLHSVAYPGGC